MISNPLKHLTDSAIGYDSQETNNDTESELASSFVSETISNGKENASTDNIKSSPSVNNCFVFLPHNCSNR